MRILFLIVLFVASCQNKQDEKAQEQIDRIIDNMEKIKESSVKEVEPLKPHTFDSLETRQNGVSLLDLGARAWEGRFVYEHESKVYVGTMRFTVAYNLEEDRAFINYLSLYQFIELSGFKSQTVVLNESKKELKGLEPHPLLNYIRVKDPYRGSFEFYMDAGNSRLDRNFGYFGLGYALLKKNTLIGVSSNFKFIAQSYTMNYPKTESSHLVGDFDVLNLKTHTCAPMKALNRDLMNIQAAFGTLGVRDLLNNPSEAHLIDFKSGAFTVSYSNDNATALGNGHLNGVILMSPNHQYFLYTDLHQSLISIGERKISQK